MLDAISSPYRSSRLFGRDDVRGMCAGMPALAQPRFPPPSIPTTSSPSRCGVTDSAWWMDSSFNQDAFGLFRSGDKATITTIPAVLRANDSGSVSQVVPGSVSQVVPASACDGGDAGGSPPDSSANWSTTEVQFQYGRLESPIFGSGRPSDTRILTFQHASGWEYGDNFFFIDFLDDGIDDGFNDRDAYLEWYANFSLGKILGRKVGCGPIADVGFIAGINYGADVDVLKWLPGIRIAWDLPGFAFFNTDITAFIDGNGGASRGGAPSETDSFLIDFNFAYPFSIRNHAFSIEGHIEFAAPRTNEFGNEVSWWILGQPQFRYDLGKTLFGKPNKLFVGIEWQIWPNKLGDGTTNENAIQALVVWRL